jgi:DNA invertase Pin-like site-specific DNA recombinase
MTTSSKSLEQKIESAVESLVREHLAALEATATDAVRAGFRRAAASGSTRGRAATPRRRRQGRRRTREEIAALEERLYEAICAHPGETMAVIAEAVGVSARELNRPATVLRRTGRVRSVGRRQYTRYFPLGE